MSKRTALSALVLVTTAVLCGCSPTPSQSNASSAPTASASSQSPSLAPSASASTSATPSTWESIEPRFPQQSLGKEDANHAPVFHDMRVGDHDGFYRVVVEFTGSDDVGWIGGWTTSPLTQGKGDPIDLGTPVYLDLNLQGGAMPVSEELAANYYKGPKTLDIGPIRVLENGTFEADTHIVIGMDRKREVTLSALSSPSRVVIDIAK